MSLTSSNQKTKSCFFVPPKGKNLAFSFIKFNYRSIFLSPQHEVLTPIVNEENDTKFIEPLNLRKSLHSD